MSADPGPRPSAGSPAAPHDHPPAVLVSNRQDLPVDEEELAGLAERALRGEGRSGGELSLSFVTPREMEDLHVRFMGESGPTDVLAFPMDEDGLLGDVVVCPEVAKGNNPDVAQELRLLVVHGVLHLLGFDHEQEEERRAMWQRQAAYSGVQP
jgi:probable rRNA maturation factor